MGVDIVNKAHRQGKKYDWETPWPLFRELDTEFRFTLDVCAEQHNTKCPAYLSPNADGLATDWDNEICWMNPPYGQQIKKWIQKAYEESRKGATVVGLIPARTDAAWFHHFIYGKAEIRFIKGRIKFVGAEHNAPFPSMIVIWRATRD